MPTNIDGFVVFGAIEQKWLALGGSHSPLGNPVTNESPTFDGVGRRQNFKGGMVSWHPAIGAFVVWGLIGERWLQIGAEQFGHPLTDETGTPDGSGRFNHFRALQPNGSVIGESSIYWSPPTGAHEVYGAIRDLWAAHGWERGQVGYPITAEHDRTDGSGREQQFQHGRIVWSPDTGASFAGPNIPAITLRAVVDQGRFIEIKGIRFTPGQTVKLGYDISSGGGPTTHQIGEDTLMSDGTGNFLHRIQVNLAGDISGAQAQATDIASGTTATASI